MKKLRLVFMLSGAWIGVVICLVTLPKSGGRDLGAVAAVAGLYAFIGMIVTGAIAGFASDIMNRKSKRKDGTANKTIDSDEE